MLVYIASPYGNGGKLGLAEKVENVRRAARVGAWLAEMGVMPVVPHLYHYVSGHTNLGEKAWIEIGLELMKRCDVVLRLEGESAGADEEVRVAKQMYMPVLFARAVKEEVKLLPFGYECLLSSRVDGHPYAG